MKPASRPFKLTDLSAKLKEAAKKLRLNTQPSLLEKTPKKRPDYASPVESRTGCPPTDTDFREESHAEILQTSILFSIPAELRLFIIETAVTDPLGCGFTFPHKFQKHKCSLSSTHCMSHIGKLPQPVYPSIPTPRFTHTWVNPECPGPFSIHLPGQVRRKKALEAFKALRATCRQLREETDDVFFLKNQFRVEMKKDGLGLEWQDFPLANFYLNNVRNLSIQSWMIPSPGRLSNGFVEVRLRMTAEGRWEAECEAKQLWFREEREDFGKVEEVSMEAEAGIEVFLVGKGWLRWEDLEEVRRVLMRSEEGSGDQHQST